MASNERPGPRPVDVKDRPAEPATDQPGDPPPSGALASTSPIPRTGGPMVPAKATTMALAFQGLVPTTIGEAVMLCGHLAKSTAIPAGLRNKPESILTVVLAGMELGLTPIRSLQSITNISGNLSMRADLQLGLVRRSSTLALYDESYEEKGRTDSNLAKRLQNTLKGDLDVAELQFEKIQAAIAQMPDGKPYAWALARRAGEQDVHLRTFTWLDAERAFTWEKDEDNPGAKAERKKLSEKFNYQAYPGDMYPKRARGRVLQVTHSDTLAGLPSTEALEGGQIIQGEIVGREDVGEDVPTLLAAIDEQDKDLGTSIRQGFSQLRMSPAKQLQRLVQFKGNAQGLMDWMKDEYARQRGHDGVKRDVLDGEPAAKSVVASEPIHSMKAAEPEKATPIQDAVRQAVQNIVDATPAAAAPMTSTKDLAHDFTKKVRTMRTF